MTATTWNVLCPGPSLYLVKQEDLEGAQTVAINAAIVTDLDVDVWACAESQAARAIVRNHESEILHGHPELWLHGIRTYTTRDSKLRRLKLDAIWSHCDMIGAVLDIDSELAQRTSKILFGSIYIALARIVVERDATEVHIFGNDMEGAADYDPRTGEPFPNNTPAHLWEARWAVNRGLFRWYSDLLEKRFPVTVANHLPVAHETSIP